MLNRDICAKSLIGLLITFCLSFSFAQSAEEHLKQYYGDDLWSSIKGHELTNDDLKRALLKVISSGHHAVGYDEARKQIFGKLDLKNNGSEYYIKDVYCERDYSHSQYPNLEFAPNTYPKNGDIINTEHTWPQSRFTKRYPNELQKSDIHHLFPSDSKMNSHRSSLHFGEVSEKAEALKCPTSALGQSSDGGEIVFEPPRDHKGNVARAIFYFATRYEMKVSTAEQKYLRQWNHDDPVDEEEMTRNDEIEKIQGNRNPFVDQPDLVDQIQNF